MKTVTAIVFLQIEPEWSRWSSAATGERYVWGCKVVGFTQKRPNKPRPGSVVVKLSVEIPEGAFLPLQPEAVITIPESLTQPYPIEVTAEDPS